MINKKYFVILILMAMLLTSCINNKKTEVILRPVKYIEITSAMVGGGQKTFSGVLQSDISTNLSFKVPGSIKTLNVTNGAYVKKDQIIATLDDELYVLEYEDAQASVGEARSRYVNAKKYYSRLAKLYVDGAISDRQLDDAKAEAEASANALKSFEKKSDYAKIRLSYTILKAPMDGYISSIETEVNENLGAGSPVVKFISDQESEVKINIPESYINVIQKDQKVTVTFEALGSKKFDGIIRDIGADSLNTSTYPVTIKLLSAGVDLKSGMSAEVSIPLLNLKDKFIKIPVNAVLEDKQGKFVFILEEVEEGKARVLRLPVEVGDVESSGIEIVSGLQEGDKVITAGVTKISPGMLVKIEDSAK